MYDTGDLRNQLYHLLNSGAAPEEIDAAISENPALGALFAQVFGYWTPLTVRGGQVNFRKLTLVGNSIMVRFLGSCVTATHLLFDRDEESNNVTKALRGLYTHCYDLIEDIYDDPACRRSENYAPVIDFVASQGGVQAWAELFSRSIDYWLQHQQVSVVWPDDIQQTDLITTLLEKIAGILQKPVAEMMGFDLRMSSGGYSPNLVRLSAGTEPPLPADAILAIGDAKGIAWVLRRHEQGYLIELSATDKSDWGKLVRVVLGQKEPIVLPTYRLSEETGTCRIPVDVLPDDVAVPGSSPLDTPPVYILVER